METSVEIKGVKMFASLRNQELTIVSLYEETKKI